MSLGRLVGGGCLGWGCVVGMGSHVYNIVPVDNPLANHAAVLFPEVRFHWVFYSIFARMWRAL